MKLKRCLLILIIFMMPVVFLFSGCLKQKEIEFRVQDNYIQWHYIGEENWIDLLPISELGTSGIADENTQQLAFYPLDDGTYGVGIGNATQLSHITIPDTFRGKKVTKIIDFGFSDPDYIDSDNLTSLTIGNNIKSIGEQAFNYCHNLKSVFIPDSVVEIKSQAFDQKLENIHIGSGIAKEYTDFSLSSSGKLTIKSNELNYRNLFNESNEGILALITEVEIMQGIETIKLEIDYRRVKSLKNIIVPSSVKKLDFSYPNGEVLPSVTYTSTLKQWCEIEKTGFGCTKLFIDGKEITALTKDNLQGITEIKAGSFCFQDLTSVFLPQTITTIASYTFYGVEIFCEATERPQGWATNFAYDSSIYWYSENQPITSGNFWHYDTDGQTPVIWGN